MDRSSRASDGYMLESQLREAYGRITYTQTCHNKEASRLLKWDSIIKTTQIVLAAATTGGFVVSLFADKQASTIVSGFLSFLLLLINTYVKNFSFADEGKEHYKTANQLWKIREEYVSILTDFESLAHGDIVQKRNDLQERTHQIYMNSQCTSRKSYMQTQKALKEEEEQTFSEHEIDIMLPCPLRNREQRIMLKKEDA